MKEINISNSISSNHKILIIGNFGDGNVGDEAILKGLHKEIIKAKKIWVTTFNITSFKKMHHKRLIPINPILLPIIIPQADLIIFGPGGIFSKQSGPFISSFDKIIKYSKIFNKKVIFYSIGFSQTTPNKLIKKLTKSSQLIDFISVRDKKSYENLKKFVTCPIYFTKDLAYNTPFVVLPPEKFGFLLKDKNYKIGIAVSLNDDIPITAILKTINQLIPKKLVSIYLFTFCPGFISSNSDTKINKRLYKLLTKKYPYLNIFILPHMSPEYTLSVIREMDIMIAMRYHAMIFSLMSNKKFYPLCYEEKCSNLITDTKKKKLIISNIIEVAYG